MEREGEDLNNLALEAKGLEDLSRELFSEITELKQEKVWNFLCIDLTF